VTREFTFVAGLSGESELKRHDYEQKSQSLTKTLRQSCEHSFSEIYILYMHLKNLKFVVELVMRYGNNDK